MEKLLLARSFLRQPTCSYAFLLLSDDCLLPRSSGTCGHVCRKHVKQGHAASRNELSARESERFMNHHPFSRNKYTHQHRESWKNLRDETKQTVFKKVVAKDVFYFFSGFLQTCLCFFLPPGETFPQEVATNTAMRCTGIAEPKRPNTCRPEHGGIGDVVDMLTVGFLVNRLFLQHGISTKKWKSGKQRGRFLLFQKDMNYRVWFLFAISKRYTRCRWIRCIYIDMSPIFDDSFPRVGSRYRRGVLQSSISLIHLQIHRVFASMTSAAHVKGRELLVLASIKKGRKWSSPVPTRVGKCFLIGTSNQ